MGMRFDKEYEATLLARADNIGQPASIPTENAYVAFAKESDFQAAVVAKAKELGWKVYHTYDSRKSEPGWPDLSLCRPPRMMFMELKAEDGKLTPAQKAWLTAMQKCDGVEAHAFWPHHWETIVKLLA